MTNSMEKANLNIKIKFTKDSSKTLINKEKEKSIFQMGTFSTVFSSKISSLKKFPTILKVIKNLIKRISRVYDKVFLIFLINFIFYQQ